MELVKLGESLVDEEPKTAVVAAVAFFTLVGILVRMELITLGVTLVDKDSETAVLA